MTYFDHLFMAVSLVCVSGLTLHPIAEVYNVLGQSVCLLLIQIGGLGLFTLLALSIFYLKNKLSLKDQQVLKVSFSHETHQNLKDLLKSVYRFTFLVEIIAASIMSIYFVKRFGLGKGIFNAMFIAVSAFCNAGFVNYTSSSFHQEMLPFWVSGIISLLVLMGGIGFIVWFEVASCVKEVYHMPVRSWKFVFRRLSIHSKLVLHSTVWIIFLGTFLTWLSERTNDATIGEYSLVEQIRLTLFQVTSLRTAGFTRFDVSNMRSVTLFIYMIQMVIGGAPGGTAAGIKVTTAAILILLFRSEMKGMKHIQFNRRRISEEVIKKTVVILVFFFSALFLGYSGLLWTHAHLDPFVLLFEAVSALTTVGISLEVTTSLNYVGQCILMLLMFLGRVGPATVLLSLARKESREVYYAKADVFLG